MAWAPCHYAQIRRGLYMFARGRRAGSIVRARGAWEVRQRGRKATRHKTLRAARRAACGG